MTTYRLEFEAALRLFARVSEAMKARGFQAPVLVSGAAVEIYSLSTIATGDFDICTGGAEGIREGTATPRFRPPVGTG